MPLVERGEPVALIVRAFPYSFYLKIDLMGPNWWNEVLARVGVWVGEGQWRCAVCAAGRATHVGAGQSRMWTQPIECERAGVI